MQGRLCFYIDSTQKQTNRQRIRNLSLWGMYIHNVCHLLHPELTQKFSSIGMNLDLHNTCSKLGK